MPFKPFHKLIPDNYALSKHRLSILKKKQDKNKKLGQEFKQVFDNYLKNGRIKKIDDNDFGVFEKAHYFSSEQLFNIVRDHSHMTSHSFGGGEFQKSDKI